LNVSRNRELVHNTQSMNLLIGKLHQGVISWTLALMKLSHDYVTLNKTNSSLMGETCNEHDCKLASIKFTTYRNLLSNIKFTDR